LRREERGERKEERGKRREERGKRKEERGKIVVVIKILTKLKKDL